MQMVEQRPQETKVLKALQVLCRHRSRQAEAHRCCLPQGRYGLSRASKSECIRFVHSCCSLGLFFSGYELDSGCDLRLIIEVGQFVQPWSVCLQVPYNITDHIA